jgi:4'-phosphopantetheinyl transferase
MSQSFNAFLSCFRSQLTDRERVSIASYPNPVAQYTHFYIHWALKEAFVKAVGQGIGYDLLSVEFVVRYSKENFEDFDDLDDHSYQAKLDVQGRAELRQHGESRTDWKFEFWTLDGRYIIAVGRGPIRDAMDDYRSKLAPSRAASEEETTAINEPLSAVQTLRIENLLASEDKERWQGMR